MARLAGLGAIGPLTVMNSTTFMLRSWFREYGLLLFNGGLLLAPSAVLAVWSASDLPLLAGGMAMSVLVLLLPALLVSTWRALFLVHFPMLGLSPLFVWYVLNFSAPPDENAFAVLLTSTASECLGFVKLFRLQGPLLACAGVAILYLIISFRLGTRPIPPRLRRAERWLAPPLLLLLLCIPERTPRGPEIDIGANIAAYLTRSYPFGGIVSLAGGLEGTARARGVFESSEPYQARLAGHSEGPSTHILVIGESARADRFGLLGYPRQTTPQLDRVEGLLVFPNTYATGNLTLSAVPMLMTGASPATYDPGNIRGNLVDLVNEAGYFTAWLSNQNVDLYKTFRPRPQVWRQPVSTNHWADQHATPDDLLLAPLDDVLKHESTHKFIVMHTYGSHWDYAQRLPDDGFHFSGSDRQTVATKLAADQSGRVASDLYDDTIRHTDYVLSQVIQRAASLPGEVTVTYIPDHGEALQAVEGRMGHGFREFNVSEVHIPLLVWANASFRASRALQWEALVANRNEVVSQDAIFHTTASLLGIDFPAKDSGRDLTSTSFRPTPLPQLRFLTGGSPPLQRLSDALDWPVARRRLRACD